MGQGTLAIVTCRGREGVGLGVGGRCRASSYKWQKDVFSGVERRESLLCVGQRRVELTEDERVNRERW
jgi:hypothetical protein